MNKWKPYEVDILTSNYNKMDNEELMKLFPERTFVSVYKKAKKLGISKDPKIEFLNRSKARKGSKCCNWKGGKKKTPKGYIQILMPSHPRADKNGYVMEHIVIFEKGTGISVPFNCDIHHLNGDKTDNRIENLCLMSHGAHTTYHNNIRWEDIDE